MDLTQQVKNFQATQRQNRSKQVHGGASSKAPRNHGDALQAYSNGDQVPYGATLRVVQHEGSRAPTSTPAKTQKPPGYIRNESGGFFTS